MQYEIPAGVQNWFYREKVIEDTRVGMVAVYECEIDTPTIEQLASMKHDIARTLSLNKPDPFEETRSGKALLNPFLPIGFELLRACGIHMPRQADEVIE